MSTRSLRRLVPRPLRRIYRLVFPRKERAPVLRTHIDRAAGIRKVVLPLPQRDGVGQRGQTRTSLNLNVPINLWVPKALAETGLANYEAETLGVFLALTHLSGNRAVFFDIGSNVGPFCLLAAALTKARVVAFEPAPETAQSLERIRDDNGLKIDIEQIALGEKEGEAEFYLSAQSDASNSLRPEFRQHKQAITVKVETLDGYCARTGLKPTIMKIDTESTEPSVLRGAHDLLTETRPVIICEVLPGWTENDLEDIFKRYGYTFYAVGTGGTLEERERIEGDKTYQFRDWLFAPEPLPAGTTKSARDWYEAIQKTRPA